MEISEIKVVLKERRITYAKLAEMSGVPIQTLQKIFSGLTQNPRIDTMQAIERALGLNEKVYEWYTLTSQENELVTEFRKLVPAMREFILDSVKKLNAAQEREQ